MITILKKYLPEGKAKECLNEILKDFMCVDMHKAKRIFALIRKLEDNEFVRLTKETETR